MSSTAMKIALTFTAIDAASATIGTLGRHLGSLGEAGKRAQKDFDSMTRSMTEGLKGLTATWLAFEKLKPVISIAAGMQESMTKLEISLARSGQNAAVFNAELEKMRDAAGKLQVLFPFGQKEMIEAATVLAQSGMKAEDISSPTGALFSVGALASLGDISTIEAAKAIAQLGSIFNLKGSQLGEAADWMQQIGKTTLLHVADMGPALSEGGQLAKQYHLNAKDTITALATLAQQSGSASKAGDELQEFLSRLQGVGKQGKKAMEEAGLNFFDSRGNLKNFHEIVKTLQAWEETPQMRAMTEQQRLDIREKIFGLRGQRAASAFAARGDNSLASIEERAAKSLHIQEALDIIQKDLTQQYRALIGTIKTAIADGFAPMLPALSSLTARLNEAASAADEFAKRHPEGMKKAEEIGAGAMGIGFVWSIFKIFKGLRHGLSGLKALAGLGGMGMDLVEGKATAAITRAMPVFIVGAAPGIFRGGLGMPALGGTAANVATAASAAETAGGAGATGAALGASAPWAASLVSGGFLLYLEYLAMKNAPLQGPPMNDWNPTFRDYGADSRGKGPLRDDWNPEFMTVSTDKIADAVKNVKPEVHSEVNITVNVDQAGRVTSATDDPKTFVNLKRGRFWADMGDPHY